MTDNRYIPRSVREALDPRLKRERMDQQKFELVMQNILRRYSSKLNRRYNIHSSTEKDLFEIVEQLLRHDDKLINRYLFELLRGNYIQLAREVQKHL